MYFGEGYYGVEAASRGYFGKSAADLSRPKRRCWRRWCDRRRTTRPASHGRARPTPEPGADADARAGPHLGGGIRGRGGRPVPRRVAQDVAATADRGRRQHRPVFPGRSAASAVQLFGADRVLRGGLRVYSTYDPEMQRDAERAIATRIAQIARRAQGARATSRAAWCR